MGNKHMIEDDAARIGFVMRRLPPDFRRVEWKMQCSKCPTILVAHFDLHMKPEAMARHARTRQWDCGYGMRPLCPACMHSKAKGPLPKPEGQSFDRFVPPPTQIFDALLDASNARAKLAKVELAKEKLREFGFEGSTRAEADAWCDKVEAEEAQLVKVEKKALEKQSRAEASRASLEKARAARIARLAKAHADGTYVPARRSEEIKAKNHAAWAATANRARAVYLQRCAQRKAAEASTGPRAKVQSPAPIDTHLQEQTASQTTTAPQAEEEVMNMPAINPTPSPKITHAVFQLLDDVFDAKKRLYKNGYTDQRVAKEVGTSDAVVAYLRNETFGQLAEDPRVTSLRDDLDLLQMESAESFAKLQKEIAACRSRLEQLAHK